MGVMRARDSCSYPPPPGRPWPAKNSIGKFCPLSQRKKSLGADALLYYVNSTPLEMNIKGKLTHNDQDLQWYNCSPKCNLQSELSGLSHSFHVFCQVSE